jgi:hypothetical protein
MARNEKGRPAEREPIPNSVCNDNSELASLLLIQQRVARLTHRYGITASMAEALAPMIFGVLS